MFALHLDVVIKVRNEIRVANERLFSRIFCFRSSKASQTYSFNKAIYGTIQFVFQSKCKQTLALGGHILSSVDWD